MQKNSGFMIFNGQCLPGGTRTFASKKIHFKKLFANKYKIA